MPDVLDHSSRVRLGSLVCSFLVPGKCEDSAVEKAIAAAKSPRRFKMNCSMYALCKIRLKGYSVGLHFC